MSENLFEFWQRCPLERPPFAHPDDRDKLHEILSKENRWIEDDATCFDSYINHPRFGDPTDDRLHLSLLPIPYVGDLRSAEIVILLLNPGFDYSDYWAEQKMPDFQKRLKQNLSQSFEGIEYPFFGLDPHLCWYSGFMWWERKLREVVQQIAVSKFDGIYRDALRNLSRKLACVELIPYHSASFRDHNLIGQLPSIVKARAFVRDSLVPEAVADKRTLICTRQAASWGLGLNEQPNVIVYDGGHTRGASLSSRSKGGEAILRRYGIV